MMLSFNLYTLRSARLPGSHLASRTLPSSRTLVLDLLIHNRLLAQVDRDLMLLKAAEEKGVGPVDLPEGYHTPTREQSQITHAPVPSRVAPGPACRRAAPDRRDATQPQPVRSTPGAVTGPSNVEKL
ncbi:MAG: hypothetical protein ACREQ5_20000 [Candidatus Dormibacteria bacterium]